jgi:uncharacterized protein involved in exopolysaccharide biosynthesis
MTKDEALNMAFDLVIMHHTDDGYSELRQKVRHAIKQAFAAPVEPDYKQLYEQVCEQYDVLAKELEATNRQVEILSDALAESRREIDAMVAVARADEREQIEDEWSMCVQSDLEHGVKSLNEQAAKDWFKNYPEIAKFGAWLAARGNT